MCFRWMCCAALMGAMPVSAQDSKVTLYGVADVFLGAGQGAGKTVGMMDGGLQASRVGVRGREALGQGLRAGFVLEAGLALNSGSGTLPGPALGFTRLSALSLGGAWGEVSLGRQLTPVFHVIAKSDAMRANAVFSPLMLWSKVNAQPGLLPWRVRANQGVTYSSPPDLPLLGMVTRVHGSAADHYLSASLAYQAGPFWLGWGYQSSQADAAGGPAGLQDRSRFSLFAGTYSQSNIMLGASWGSQGADRPGAAQARLLNLSLEVKQGPGVYLLSHGRRDLVGSSSDQVAWALGYDHWLSKRFAFYARGLWMKNQGHGDVSLGGVAVVPQGGQSIRLWGLGLLHRF